MRRFLRAVLLLGWASACTVRGVVIAPWCEPNQRLAIVAQSVPTAVAVPCIAQMPAGWSAGGVEVETGRTRFWLNSDRAGDHAVEIQLAATCDIDGATATARELDWVQRYERSDQMAGRLHLTVLEVFDGGCISTSLDLPVGSADMLAAEALDAASLYPREELRAEMLERSGVDIGPAQP